MRWESGKGVLMERERRLGPARTARNDGYHSARNEPRLQTSAIFVGLMAATPKPKRWLDVRAIERFRVSLQLSSIMLLLGGLAFGVSLASDGLFVNVVQWYPVRTFHFDLEVAPTETRVVAAYELNERPSDAARQQAQPNSSVMSARVRLERPIPVDRGIKGSVRAYDSKHHEPGERALSQAGPERAVEVTLFPSLPIAPETNALVLAAMADWVFRTTGDVEFAAGVRAGGIPRPEVRHLYQPIDFRTWLLVVASIAGGLGGLFAASKVPRSRARS